MKSPFCTECLLVSMAFLAGACHGSSPRSSQAAAAPSAPSASAFPGAPSATGAPSDTSLHDEILAESSEAVASVDVPIASDSVPEYRTTGDTGDVIFHTVNETGHDVFIDEENALTLELRGELVELNGGCGSECPSCACKECPIEPPRLRRIAHTGGWDSAWNQRVYVSRNCGGACPCIQAVHAKAGTYTATVYGKRGVTSTRTVPWERGSKLDENSANCVAKTTFKLAPSAHVNLEFTCER